MAYFARPNESSPADMQKASIRNLQILQRHIQKQISVQEEIQKNLHTEIQNLQTTKNSLISLIQQNVQAQISNQPQKPAEFQNKSLIIGINSQLNVKLVASPKDICQKSPSKSSSLNQSQLLQNKQKPKEKPINYLTNMNEYKHKDLVQELKSLLKQLNSIIKNSNSKQLANSSLLMQSKYQNPSVQIGEKDKDALIEEQQFIQKYLLELGDLQKLPTSSVSQPSDEVLSSLMTNLKKEELRLIQNTWKYQKLQIKKLLKQNLQEKTIENMRLTYKEKKRVQSKVNVRQVKCNKDIIKFGYTDRMISLIQKKTGSKGKIE